MGVHQFRVGGKVSWHRSHMGEQGGGARGVRQTDQLERTPESSGCEGRPHVNKTEHVVSMVYKVLLLSLAASEPK
jgi:hypothetical protein